MNALKRLAHLVLALGGAATGNERPTGPEDPSPRPPPPPQPTDPLAEIKNANQELRATAKWILTTFAAIGAVFAGSITVSSVGKLTGDVPTVRVVAAVLGMAATVTGIAIAIGFTSSVLAPFFNSFRSADLEPKVTERVLGDRELIGVTYGELKEKMQEAGQAVAAKRRALRESPDDKERQQELKAAEDVRQEWAGSKRLALAVIGRELLWSRYERARDLTIFVALPLVVAGVGAFAWGANPPESETEGDVSLGRRPVHLNVTLTAMGVEALANARDCSDPTLQVLSIAGTDTSREVVTIPTAACRTARFTLTSALGTATAAEP